MRGRVGSGVLVRIYGLPGFYEASGTSTRNRPHEPTTSKPVVPWGCAPPILDVTNVRGHAELRCRGHRCGAGGGSGGRKAGGARARRGDRRGPAGGRRVL